jgi:hypothetical protein
LEDTSLKKVPFKAWTERNSYADILLEAKDDDPLLNEIVALDWTNYYVRCYDDLRDMKQMGSEISRHLESLDRVLDSESPELRMQVRAKLQSDASRNSPSKNRLKSILQRAAFSSSFLLRGVMLCAPQYRFGRRLILRGDKAKFSSILECAAMFDEAFLAELVRFWGGNRVSVPRNGRLS